MGTGLSHADFGGIADEPDDASFAPPPPADAGRSATAPAPPVTPAPHAPPPVAGRHALVTRLRRIAAAAGDQALPVIDFDAPAHGLEDDLEPAFSVPGADA